MNALVNTSKKPVFLILIFIAALKVGLHMIVNATTAYGYFRDEFYYIACSENLAWGYVDQPPLSIALLKLSGFLFGDSLWAIRVFPALAGAGVIFFTGLIVMKLGGKRFEVLLAGIGGLIAPIFLAMHGFYSMNAFDHLFWVGTVYLLMLIIEKPSLSLWILLGFVLGLGLMNKISVLWLGAGIFMGLVLTPNRILLKSKEPYLAAIIAFLIFMPYIIWQQGHDWPLIEFMMNASSNKYVERSLLDFISGVTLTMHPLNFLLWACGLAYFFLHKEGKQYRILGIVFITIFAILAINKTSKPEYMAPAFPMLFAGGAVMVGRWFKGGYKWAQASLIVFFVAGGILTAPLVLPVLPVERYIAYAKMLGEEPSTTERKALGPLPQFYADMHGWENMAKTVSDVYVSLPENDKANAKVFGQNYGEAGAINFYKRKYPLPVAISSHNNYWIWGPGETSEDLVLIIIGSNIEDNARFFEIVEQKGKVVSEYAMPYESNLPIFVGKRPKKPLEVVWGDLKHFD